MRDDEQLENHLQHLVNNRPIPIPIIPDELANRVRNLRTRRAQRRRTLTAVSLLLLAGIGIYSLITIQEQPAIMDSPLVTNLPEPSADSSIAEHSDVSEQQLQAIRFKIDQVQQQAELALLDMRIHQAIAKAERLIEESNRRTRREQQSSLWLTATFREMSSEGIR